MVKTTHSSSDVELLKAYRKGDIEAFAAFTRRYQNTIYRLALYYLHDTDFAEEAAQEVFLRAWQKLRNWRFGRGKPFTWLYRTLLNVCRELDKKRIRNAKISQFQKEQETLGNAQVAFEHDIIEKSHLAAIVRALPKRQQQIVMLHIYEDLTLKQIANLLELPLGTVKSNYHKALRNLRNSVGG